MTAHEYLTQKGIPFHERGKELLVKCLFGDCDKDSRANEYHLYVSQDDGLYHCKKCDASGNLITLMKHLGDDPGSFRDHGSSERVGRVSKKKAQEKGEPLTDEQVRTWQEALPDDIRGWLRKERGLTDAVISSACLGWDGERLIIPIRDENGTWFFAKRRQPPGKEGTGPKYQYPAGAKAALYGAELLENADSVVICEGELDALNLRSNGLLSVSSTGGAGTFEDSWAKAFAAVPEVFVIYDHDEAGKKGALKVGKCIPHARIAMLPASVGDHGDVTDFLVRLGKTPQELWELLQTGRTAKDIMESGERFASLPAPLMPTTIDMWRQVIAAQFPECLAAAEVGVAVITQLLIADVRNPFGLVYVDVPSAGKTITLNFFSDIDELAYSTDAFSPASLVSHASNRKKEALEQIDLLPRIRHKMLVVRDLAPMFAERQENLLKNLGVLTRVFDGEGYESDSGVHGKRGYKGDYTFMFLAGSTPIAPRVWKFMGNLGSRLFFLNMNVTDKSEEELADLLVQNDFKRKEKECREATRQLILTIWARHPDGVTWEKKSDPRELRAVISRCAKLLAHLRGTVNVWNDDEDGSKQHHTNVVIEKPIRINQLLYNLARGHALSCGRTVITEEDIWPVIEAAFNSAQYNRIKLLNVLIENAGTAGTAHVEWAIGCSNPTALKEIETLRILDIVETQDVKTTNDAGRPERIVTIRPEFTWFCSEECKRLRDMKPK
ncbi:MAG: toprim domain-containing protein [Parcubacteria group bacterium]|nr:toprim domain-containing protein [Parcubacteria group bacterium]